eukprot:TRINITY_DN6478_c0_g1_i3.p1 TRINITY_DN6478_c0_g1~~TRINITY_DN6478_c0_g1_i3.p1  ORF type:complete len:363 (-),score=93.37 TRINITY_DN6478_c0_g1_i3:252-1340(-)
MLGTRLTWFASLTHWLARSSCKFLSLSISSTRIAQYNTEQSTSHNGKKEGVNACKKGNLSGAIKKSGALESRVKDYAVKSVEGKSPSDPNKKNQDAEFFIKSFNGLKNVCLLGVLDGHGSNGHLVSNFIKDHYISNLKHCLQSSPTPNFTLPNPHLLHEAFKMTNADLEQSGIDVSYSGTTLNTVLMAGSQVVCANVGDSRAIVGSWSNRAWVARTISQDHKPDRPEECERIVGMNGRVETLKDNNGTPIGPARVWRKERNTPGLAMSRSLGDKVAEALGVVWTPEVTAIALAKSDKLVVVASDGVYEQLSSQEVVEVVGKFWCTGRAKEAAEELVGVARRKWVEEDEEVVDDITAIVVFLN